MSLSVVLATFNEQENLPKCLDSVKDLADEIVVVDGSSTDRTVEIARRYGAKVVVTTNKPIFHINKQIAIDRATKDWILQLDADEQVTPELAEEIRLKVNPPAGGQKSKVNGYWIPRKNWFLGRFLMKGGAYPDYTLRLYRRGKGKLPQKSVHEQAVVEGEVGYLKNPLIHMADPTFSRYLIRWNRYVNLIRDELFAQRPGPLTFIDYLIIKPMWWFFLTYIRHKGFLDSWQGFIFSLFSALRFPVAYVKYLQKNKKAIKITLSVILILIISYKTGFIIVGNYPRYFSNYYTEAVYKNLEKAFNSSQYRQKDQPSIIPDETLFSYAAGAYLRGVDPILINSEHTPLGKYFIALSILWLKNDNFIVIPFSILTLFALWLLGKKILQDNFLALIPVAIFSFEELYLNQLIFTPLLDIIQLPLIILALYLFLIEYTRKRFIFTAITIGAVMATKSIVPGLLLIVCFLIFLLIKREFKKIINFFLALPLAASIFIGSYIRTFLSGYNLFDFIGFQKWIFLYQQSKLIFPFSFWQLAFFNKWQTWWGEKTIMPAEDWQVTWPIFTFLPFVLVFLFILKKIKITQGVFVLLIWIFTYELFLSLGVVSSRFLLPLLPVLFVIGIYIVREFFHRASERGAS